MGKYQATSNKMLDRIISMEICLTIAIILILHHQRFALFQKILEFVVVIWKGGTLTFNLDIAKILVTLDAVEIRIIFQLKRNANKHVDRIPIKSVPIINPIIGATTMLLFKRNGQ